MAKNCLECGKKKGLFDYNYAGFDVRRAASRPMADRYEPLSLPGTREKDFLCVKCANKRKVVCQKHGNVPGSIEYGAVPVCQGCVREENALHWFHEAQTTHCGAASALIGAADRDVIRMRRGEIQSAKEGEHARISAKVNDQVNRCLEKALQIDACCAPALYAKGDREGNLAAALGYFDKAIAAAPTFSSAYYGKAKILEGKGDIEEALACYDRAVELDPNDAEAMMGKSRLLARKGMQSDAAQLAQKAKELDPSLGQMIRLVKSRWLLLKN